MQRVLVTGGSRGIGREIVRKFDSAGDAVFFSYATDVKGAEQTARQCPRATNCAGVYPHAAFTETPPAMLAEVMRVNFEAPYRLMQLTAERMAAGGGGAI